MAVGDETEDRSSSLLVDALKTATDPLSPDDLAWADSCIVNDPDASDIDWSCMKDALVEILGLQPEARSTTAPLDEISRRVDRGTASDSSDDEDMNESSQLLGEASLRDAFQPRYKEDDLIQNGSILLELDSANESDLRAEDIFKVWDLYTLSDELEDEDSLGTQLNKALSNSPLPAETLPINVALELNELPEDTLQDLISSINDLSLG